MNELDNWSVQAGPNAYRIVRSFDKTKTLRIASINNALIWQEEVARLIVASAMSYRRAFGPAAVKAAEADLLGRMKAVLTKLLTWQLSDEAVAQLRDEAGAILARTEGGGV